MKDKIIHFINTEIVNAHEEEHLTESDDLLASGLIDSMGLMKLVGYLESEFDVKIPPTDIVIENFENINTITEYLSDQNA